MGAWQSTHALSTRSQFDFRNCTRRWLNCPTDVIIDGEIITARGEEILPFSDLQKRLGRKTVSEELLATTPVVFVGWDLLYATGKVLINDPLQARRARLEEIIGAGSERVRLSHSKRFTDPGSAR